MRAIVQHGPADAAKLIEDQLTSIVITATGKKGIGLTLALVLALYSAMKGAGAVVAALNVAYEVPEDRSFVRTTGVNAAVTVGTVLVAVAALTSGSVFAALGQPAAGLSPLAAVIDPLTAMTAVTAVALLYRCAPARHETRWQWVTPGSLLTMVDWLAV